MVQQGRYISGEFHKLINLTKNWAQVDIDIEPYDDRFMQIIEIAKHDSEGNFADLHDERSACVRFELDSDAAKFKEQLAEF